MSNIKINDVPQRIQYSATGGQTQFTIPFPFFQNNYVYVWLNGVQIFQGGGAGEYVVTGASSPSGGLVTFNTAATLNDIVTIEGLMPIDRTSIYSPTISNLTGSDLNGDFNREVVMLQQLNTTQSFMQLQYAPWSEISQDLSDTTDRYIPLLEPNQTWAMNDAGTEIIAYDVPSGGGLAPSDATYLLQTANSELPNAQAMGALASGFVVNTNTTGLQLTREFQGASDQLGVNNPTGIGGNPQYYIVDNPTIPGTAGMGIPAGTTAERVVPTPPSIGLRYNTDLAYIEAYIGGNWVEIPSSSSGLFLPLAGGTMSGNIDMDGNSIENVDTPVSNGDAANKAYVDTFLPLAGGTMTGDIDMDNNDINNLPLPVSPDQPATKGYVDGLVLNLHPACSYATTANLAGYTYDNGVSGVGATLTAGSNGAFVADGQNPLINNRILVRSQSAAAENGIYTLTQVGDGSNPAILTRALDYNTAAQMQAGDEVAVVAGNTLAGSKWMMTQTAAITVGTTAITWIDISVPDNVVTLDGAQTITGQKTFVAPILGTPASGTLTNCTGLPVAGGGTGRASHTEYAVICGGTSTTNPQQSIASVGAAGQVLTSNGAAALPTFQDVAGSVIQLQRTTATTGASSSAVIPTDNSIPQIGEGTEFFTVSITPTNSANTLVIEVFIPVISVSIAGSVSMVGALFVDATANALCVDFGGINSQHMYMKFVTTAGSTSARTYRFRFGPGVAGTAYCNQGASGNLYSTASVAFIQVTELSI